MKCFNGYIKAYCLDNSSIYYTNSLTMKENNQEIILQYHFKFFFLKKNMYYLQKDEKSKITIICKEKYITKTKIHKVERTQETISIGY